jgi:hypothetical protein
LVRGESWQSRLEEIERHLATATLASSEYDERTTR